MKLNYTVKQLNNAFDDNAFFIRNKRLNTALLLDCGKLGGLDNSSLLDVSHIFVSHTHMDHFSGFDRVLRSAINSDNTIRFYGPDGFTKNVAGKLAGYNWNLIRDYKLVIEAIELSLDGNKRTVYAAENGFEPITMPDVADVIDIGDGFTVRACAFDHGITSMGYRISEPIFISVMKDTFNRQGFVGGAWVKELKKSLEDGLSRDKMMTVVTVDGDRDFTIGELEERFIEYHTPQHITYITDIAPTEDNIEKAIDFAKDSTILMIESVFSESDMEHARAKNHLAIPNAKHIFKSSGASFVRFMHFAPRYEMMKQEFMSELYNGISKNILQI